MRGRGADTMTLWERRPSCRSSLEGRIRDRPQPPRPIFRQPSSALTHSLRSRASALALCLCINFFKLRLKPPLDRCTKQVGLGSSPDDAIGVCFVCLSQRLPPHPARLRRSALSRKGRGQKAEGAVLSCPCMGEGSRHRRVGARGKRWLRSPRRRQANHGLGNQRKPAWRGELAHLLLQLLTFCFRWVVLIVSTPAGRWSAPGDDLSPLRRMLPMLHRGRRQPGRTLPWEGFDDGNASQMCVVSNSENSSA